SSSIQLRPTAVFSPVLNLGVHIAGAAARLAGGARRRAAPSATAAAAATVIVPGGAQTGTPFCPTAGGHPVLCDRGAASIASDATGVRPAAARGWRARCGGGCLPPEI